MATRLLVASLAMLVVALTPVAARRVVDLESATIADLNAAFKAGTLTAEKLTELFLARIETYDRRGPSLRALIAVNPKARETARALDVERNRKREFLRCPLRNPRDYSMMMSSTVLPEGIIGNTCSW